MSTFQNVALLGKGFLGSAILNELVKAGFTVTVLGRSESSKQGLPTNVKFIAVDYSSFDSLLAAFQGQDAVVSTVSKGAMFTQRIAIDACIRAGVRRYIPSDWGSFTTDPAAHRDAPGVFGPMVDIQNYLAEKGAAGEIEHTIFSVGAFTDFAVRIPLAFDFPNKHIELWDGGRHRFSTTSVAGIGRAVAGALKNPEATKNRKLKVQEMVVSQAQLVALAKKFAPPGTEWTQTEVNGKEEFEKALQVLEKDPTNEHKVLGVIKAGLMGGRFESEYTKVDNELVGLPLLTEKDLEARFAEAYKS